MNSTEPPEVPDRRTAFDDAFDEAFSHLAQCRIAYEESPRDATLVDALAQARDQLEQARRAMDAERQRLGLSPRRLPPSPVVKIEGQAMHLWQSIQQEG